ncbi:nuclear transport factor 2 family protein [Herbiconiux liangxiaofengii]|uniref:nuclear transport factor 2 family protein n=1 Tax=Herbiconiux liangxiaofengii TaxID=3342795 RepID=UPI0035B795D8
MSSQSSGSSQNGGGGLGGHGGPGAAVDAVESELIVREFVDMLNEGALCEIAAYLSDSVLYQPSPNSWIRGRQAVLSMLDDVRHAFEHVHTRVEHVAVCGGTVLVEQRMALRLDDGPGVELMSFASFRLEGYRITEWHQLQG